MKRLLALVLALCTPLLAQETKIDVSDGTQHLGQLRMTTTSPCENSLGLGYVDAEFTNATAEPLSVEVLLRDGSSGRGTRIREQLRLAPRAKERFWMPFTARSYYNLVSVTIGSVERTSSVQATTTRDRLLLVGTEPSLVSGWVSGYASHIAGRGAPKRARPRRSGSTGTDEVIARAPADLPPLWQWLTGFEVIVVDANANGLTPERQELLASYAQAGGNLIVLHAARAGAGPLAELVGKGAGARTSPRPCFGTVIAVDDDGLAELGEGRIDTLLEKVAARPPDAGPGVFTGDILSGNPIPGLGRSPARWFVVFAVLFILFVLGALWYYGRRTQTPLKLLLVLPITGFGTATSVLMFGYFREGLTTRGVVEAVSLLDQGSQRHVTLSSRTLYAPISPRALVPDAATAWCSQVVPPMSWNASTHALEVDIDALPRIGGAALPSRLATTFGACTTAKTRERVSFRSEGGGLRLLSAPGLAALPGSPVVVRDLAGTVHAGQADGLLTKVDDEMAALRELAKAAQANAPLPRASSYQGPPVVKSAENGAAIPNLSTLLERRFQNGLPPGTYAMLVGESTLLDEFGLSVSWKRRVHLVVGTLTPEDVVK